MRWIPNFTINIYLVKILNNISLTKILYNICLAKILNNICLAAKILIVHFFLFILTFPIFYFFKFIGDYCLFNNGLFFGIFT